MESHGSAEGVFLKTLRCSPAFSAKHNGSGHGRQSARGYGSWNDSVEQSHIGEPVREDSAPAQAYKAGFGGQGRWREEEEVVGGGISCPGVRWVGAGLPENGVTGAFRRDGGLHSGAGNASPSHDGSNEDSV